MHLTDIAVFSEFPILRDLRPDDIKRLALRYRQVTYGAGQIVLDREDSARDVYFVQSGRLLAVYWTEDGKELVFGRIQTGAYLGEVAALDDGDRSLAVYAQTEARVLVMEQASFLALMDQIPAFRQKVTRDLVARIRTLTKRNFEVLAFNVDMRVRSYLARLALEAGVFHAGGLLTGAPTHAEIANTIGANREAVSRAMSALNRDGVVTAGRQKIQILQPDALLATASG